MLSGKLCVVTGGASGIGKAVCEKFANLGATVVAADVNKKAIVSVADSLKPNDNSFANNGHCGVQCDVSGANFVKQLRDFILGHYSAAPSIVVNAAGVTMDGRLHKITEEQWNWVLDVNLKGTFLINQTFSETMIAEKVTNGSLVNIASIFSRVPNFGQTNYVASKAGVVGLTKAVALELASHGIRVNAVLPGFIETPMTDKVPAKIRQTFVDRVPLGRMGRPEEIAEVCAFLAGDASSYVTGACLDVNGGALMC